MENMQATRDGEQRGAASWPLVFESKSPVQYTCSYRQHRRNATEIPGPESRSPHPCHLSYTHRALPDESLIVKIPHVEDVLLTSLDHLACCLKSPALQLSLRLGKRDAAEEHGGEKVVSFHDRIGQAGRHG